jgi:orotate phosphoribosyltransferase
MNYLSEMLLDKEPGLASDLCKMLVKTGCMKFGVFKLKKGKLSPYYIDLRLIPSFPNSMNKIVSIYEDLAKNKIGTENFDRISGIPTVGMTFASVLSYKLSKPFLYIKEATETHGREKKIGGALSPGDRVLLVDDVVTSGKSIMEAANIVRGEGGTISDALVLIDRQEGGAENLTKVGVRLYSFTKISEIAKELYEAELIDKRQYEEMVKQTTTKAVAKEVSS